MKTIDIDVYTLEDIGRKDFAKDFFKHLEALGIAPGFVSKTEPINIPYTIDKAVELWSKEEDGGWDLNLMKPTGKAGDLLARNREYSITYISRWWKLPERKVNYISYYISIAKYSKKKTEIFELFKYLVESSNAVYGYITHSDARERQHGTGGIEHRLPGMFWCNYFSNIYIDFFGREKFYPSNWFKTKDINNSGKIIFIDENPMTRILEDKSIEENAKAFLGNCSFADPQEEEKWNKDMKNFIYKDPTQYKNVPKIL